MFAHAWMDVVSVLIFKTAVAVSLSLSLFPFVSVFLMDVGLCLFDSKLPDVNGMVCMG